MAKYAESVEVAFIYFQIKKYCKKISNYAFIIYRRAILGSGVMRYDPRVFRL